MSTSFIGRAAKLFTLKQQDLFTKLEFCSAGPQTLKHHPTFTKLESPKHHLLMHLHILQMANINLESYHIHRHSMSDI